MKNEWKIDGKCKSFPNQMLFIRFFQYSTTMKTVYRNVFKTAHDMYG